MFSSSSFANVNTADFLFYITKNKISLSFRQLDGQKKVCEKNLTSTSHNF